MAASWHHVTSILASAASASLLLVLVAAPQSSLACYPVDGTDYSKEVLMEVKVAYSPVVVSGVPVRTHDHTSNPDLYAVDLEVYCIIKGKGIKRFIRINNVGEFRVIPWLIHVSRASRVSRVSEEIVSPEIIAKNGWACKKFNQSINQPTNQFNPSQPNPTQPINQSINQPIV
ncbi:hypothetical protein ElyMa_003501400 [Elysia marginata]|uniref:Uncharacterized protein n=1 Tax=Elysia marginata TaxID=1093978 RepID=A0AAV4EEU1_9GAST|nr:hypothetical protein ElyMa_003501400 [Elysia marginata]